MKTSSLLTRVSALGILLLSAASLPAATILYDFNGPAGPQADWTNTNNTSGSGTSSSPFALNGSGQYAVDTFVNNNGTTVEISTFTVGDRQAGTNFTVSTVFTLASTASSGSYNAQFGLKLLADSNLESGTPSYYNVYVGRGNGTSENEIKIERRLAGTTTTAHDTDITSNWLTTGKTYTLTVTGTYNGSGHLTLGYSVNDGTQTYQNANAFTDTAPISGDIFGLRARARAFASLNSTTMNARADSFTLNYVAVPEPGAGAALTMGIAGLILFRRRRA